MAKIFFSYSWAQENIVDQVGNDLGRDFVTQDKFNFDAGNPLDDEMKDKISNSDLFVFFLSKDSITSKNVQLELDYVLPLIASDMMLFLPILIDEDVKIGGDWGRYTWIKKYLLTYTTNTPRIVRTIRQKIRSLICKKYGVEPRFFKGRELDKAEITKDYFYGVNEYRRAVIVSGQRYVGRKSLLIETLISSLDKSLDSNYEPISVSLNDTDSIDTLIIQLSSYTSIKDVDARLENGEYCTLLVDILNDLQKDNQKIIVDDKQCVILRNGQIVDWFAELIRMDSLANYTHFYIASEYTVSPSVSRAFPELQTHRIDALTKDDMRTIFSAYMKQKQSSCSDFDTKFFVDKFNGYPQLILNVVDDISKSGVMMAKRWLDNNLKLYDKSNRELLDAIKEDEDLYNLVLVLSRLEYLSYDALCDLLPDVDVLAKLEKMYYMSISEHFGGQYYRLSRSLSEYINRNNIELDPNIDARIRDYTSQALDGLEAGYLDLSEQLVGIKEAIRRNADRVPISKLLPSFTLKVIIDLYYKKDYKTVQLLALRLLNDSHQNIYDSVIRSLKYWLCLAASRNKDKKVFDAHVGYFSKPNPDYNSTFYFLKGFYERCRPNYTNAQKWYEKSLACPPNEEQGKYLAKVKHELALVYMKQDPPKALPLARENYEKAKDNAYHIETYFRCLVRSENPDVNVLNELMDKIRVSHDVYHDVIQETFDAELSYYINHDKTTAIDALKRIIEDYPNSIQYPIDALKHILEIEKSKGKNNPDITSIISKHPENDVSVYRFDID